MLLEETCKVTVTHDEWLWLRGIKCGAPVTNSGLCERHLAQRDHLLEVGSMSAHLVLVEGGNNVA